MARLSTIPRQNLEFIAQDIGDQLLPFLTTKQLAGLSPVQRVAGLSPVQRVSGLSPEQLAESLSVKEEKELLELLLKKRQSKSKSN